jgi:hypothetical protein
MSDLNVRMEHVFLMSFLALAFSLYVNTNDPWEREKDRKREQCVSTLRAISTFSGRRKDVAGCLSSPSLLAMDVISSFSVGGSKSVFHVVM